MRSRSTVRRVTARLAMLVGIPVALVVAAVGPAGAAASTTVENWSFGSFFGGVCTCFADVDGDHVADVVAIGDGPTVVRRSQTNQFNLQRENWTTRAVIRNQLTKLADVDGGGKADLVTINQDKIEVWRSTGERFEDSTLWLSGKFPVGRDTTLADVTGDGKADAITFTEEGLIVAPSRGDNFDNNQIWAPPGSAGERMTAFADVDNDGRADAIAVNNNGTTVRRSIQVGDRGTFDEPVTWAAEPHFGFGHPFFGGRSATLFADVTGDGRADSIAVSFNQITVRRSTGDGFLAIEPWTDNPFTGSRGTDFADVTGDGRADAIAVNNNGILVRRTL